MAENKEVVRVKDAAIDRTGEHSGGPVNKFTITALAGALVIYFLISSINLSAYGDMASRALGFVLAMIWFLCFSPTKMSVSALIIATIAPFVGVLAFTDVSSQLGSSSFYTIVGL
ncbi:MAG: hypothetical protein LUE31_12870, partial [Lachnospiraceae bacterium]|nr:hypothetical protein [Lachnospiraceae bacterium]